MEVERRCSVGCLCRCWSPPVREEQSMLLSPTQENLAPQAWAIKTKCSKLENFFFSTGRIAEGSRTVRKQRVVEERNLSQACVAFSSSRTGSASSLLKLYGHTHNYYH